MTSADQEHAGIRGEASGSFVAIVPIPYGYRGEPFDEEWQARPARQTHASSGRHRRTMRRILRRESGA